MRILLSILCVVFLSNGYSQYYFNDIVSTQLSNEQYKLLRSAKIHKIKAISFDSDNSLSEGFALEEDISPDGKRITLSASLSGGKTSFTNRTYESGKLKKVQLTSNGIETKTAYSYTEKGQISQLLFTTTDTALKSSSTELHEWNNTESGQPLSMLKIKNRMDTLFIELVKDEKGLVAEEHWKKKNRDIETYYYYYDTKNQLTDIVRYSAGLKKLIPDFQYEYDTTGRVSQMIQVSMSSASYLIWKYTYNEKGLKIKETCFDKEKKLVGRIEYTYE